MKDEIPSFNLIYRSTCSDIRLQSNEGKTSITHRSTPVLSNLNIPAGPRRIEGSYQSVVNMLRKLIGPESSRKTWKKLNNIFC